MLTVILLHFLLAFICFYFLLHLCSDFLSLLLLSNSIHERCTLHHSVSLYLCLPFIFSTPFCATVSWRKGERKKETERRRKREREMDRLGDSYKRSISRPNSPGRTPPHYLLSILFHSTLLDKPSLFFASHLCSLQTDKGSLRNHFVHISASKSVYVYAHFCLSL